MKKYDLINFEAMGNEAEHLEKCIENAKRSNRLPAGLRYLITTDTVQKYLSDNPDAELPELISTKTHSKLPDYYVNDGVKKSVCTRSAGYDHFEDLQDKVNVTSLREYCVNAVAQTAIKLMYDACGMMNIYTVNTLTFNRKSLPSFMELNKSRTAVVFGVGRIGRRVYELCEANGLTVNAVDIRSDELNRTYGGKVNFVQPEKALDGADIVINVMNLTRDPKSRFYNVGYFSKDYLKRANDGFVFINVTRGEIAPESALLELYSEGKISGIGLDVFSDEAGFAAHLLGNKNDNADILAAEKLLRMANDRSGNVYVQPHQGFNSDVAVHVKAEEAVNHFIAWYKNGGKCFDEQIPYYC